MVDYVEAYIKLRKNHPAFRMKTTKQIATNIRFMNNLPEQIVAYTINGTAVQDSWKKIFVIYNGSGMEQTISLPAGKWKLFATGSKISSPFTKYISVGARSCSVLYLQ
jgi:pullulanase